MLLKIIISILKIEVRSRETQQAPLFREESKANVTTAKASKRLTLKQFLVEDLHHNLFERSSTIAKPDITPKINNLKLNLSVSHDKDIIDLVFKTHTIDQETIDQVRPAVENLTQLRQKGKNSIQLQEAVKTMIGKEIDFTQSRNIGNILYKYLLRVDTHLLDNALKLRYDNIKFELEELLNNEDSNEIMHSIQFINDILELEFIKDNDKQDLEILKNIASSEYQKTIIASLKAQILDQLQFLDKSGGEISLSGNIQVGTGIKGANLSLALEVGANIKAEDDTKIYSGKEATLSLNATGGIKSIAHLSGTLSATKTKEQCFESLEDFVDYSSHKLISLFLSSNFKGTKLIATEKNRQKLERKAINDKSLLQKQLIRKKIIGTGDKIQYQQSSKVNPIEIAKTSQALAAEASLLHSIGVSAERSREEMVFTKKIPLLDFLNESLSKSEDHDYFSKNQSLISIRSHSYSSINQRLAYIKSLIEATENTSLSKKEMDEITRILNIQQIQILESLELLHYEYSVYEDVVNERERGKIKGIKAVKSSMEKGRGVKGRAEFLKSIILTHSKLKQSFLLASSHLEHDPKALSKINSFEQSYQVPNFSLKKSAEKKLAIPIQTKGIADTTTYSMTIAGQELTCEFSKSNEDLRSNESEHALSVSFPLSLLNKLLDSSILDQKIPTLSSIKKNMSQPFEQKFSTLLKNVKGLELLSTTSYDCNLSFIKNEHGQYVFQYARINKTHNIELEISDLPVGSVQLGIGAQYSKSKNAYEIIGTNTLSYIHPKFEAWHSPNDTHDYSHKLENFVKENEPQLRALFLNCANPKSNARKELNEICKDAQTGDHKVSKLFKSIEKLSQDPESDKAFKKALSAYLKATLP